MKRFYIAMATVSVMLLGLSLGGQTQKRSVQRIQARTDKEFARQWEEVKKTYPLVAMAYLRREAFAYQVVDHVAARADTSRSARAVQVDICWLFRRFRLWLPGTCTTLARIIPPDYSSCFEPQRTADHGYEMPTPGEAQDCLDEQRRLQ